MPASSVSPALLIQKTLGTRKTDLVLATILYSIHQLGEALVPVIIGVAIGAAIEPGDPGALILWLAILAADFAMLSFAYRLGARASMRAKQHGEHAVRLWLSDRILDPAGGVEAAPGELLARADSDAGRLGAFAGMLATTIAAAVVLLASTVMLLATSLPLGIVILVGTVVLLVVLGMAARPVQRRSRLEQDDRGRVIVLAEDLVRGLRVLRGLGATRAGARQYRDASQRALGTTLHAASGAATLTAIGTALTGTYLAVITILGGYLALTGTLTPGGLVAALGLARFVIGPMDTLAYAGTALARARASAERIAAILNAPAARQGDGSSGGTGETGGDAHAAGPDLSLHRVAPIAGSTEPLSVVFPGSGVTGVVASNAATAHELTALIARERVPETGEIRLDGIAYAALESERLRRAVLVSPHDAALFAGTLAEALGEGVSGVHSVPATPAPHAAPTGQAARAAHAAHAEEIAEQSTEGWAGDIGERGGALSGGQRQRLALARALATDPGMLVLHDPTTAVDAATEQLIAERVAALRQDSGTIVFTTSPAWLAHCERVVYLAADSPALTGTHAELLASNAHYRTAVLR
ncbi:ABC transporter ATP-binding protein [Mycetocola tolaasinivorans]|uniref:ABC transporter ATP-binding protein n=1 Tax=Mycetocola tolaasinivorans TaxID=76635 RepID=A0A3L7AF12_9MICO|nr:ABC transporter ATP-binding protein [Mycetocola tolaasinivorans]RLP77982.1 ABC transporter ATP-binding protein [Mycetocola tolaasinivorans]